MFRFFSILTVLLVLSLFLGLFSLISNCWNKIRIKNTSSYLEYGLWLLCPKDNQLFSSFIFNHKNCLQFNQNIKKNNILSHYLQMKLIKDVEPDFMDTVQIFYLIGTCFLFLGTMITISNLIYSAIKFNDPNFLKFDTSEKIGLSLFSYQSPKAILLTRSALKFSLVKINLRILLAFLFMEFIMRLVAFLVFTFSSEQYLNLIVEKSLSVQIKKNLTNEKSWSYWICLVSIFLSFTSQTFVLINQIYYSINKDLYSKQSRSNNAIKSNIMFINGTKNYQVMTRSNLLSIEPIEVSDDLLSKCDYNIEKVPKLDSKLFFIDNEYLKYLNKDSIDQLENDSSFYENKLFGSVNNLEKSILLDSDSQVDYINKLENMLNELYSSSTKNTLKSELIDFRIFKNSNKKISKNYSSISLPNLNEITDLVELVEKKTDKFIIREKVQYF